MNIVGLIEDCQTIIGLLGHYHNGPKREMMLDPMVYAHLSAKYPSVTRQHHVEQYGANKPKRIDYRVGGPNPVVMEFAARP